MSLKVGPCSKLWRRYALWRCRLAGPATTRRHRVGEKKIN